MRVTRIAAHRFTLAAETAEDLDLLGALEHERHARVLNTIRAQHDGYTTTSGCDLLVSRAEIVRPTLRGISDLARVLWPHPAIDGHVVRDASDPQPQEVLPAARVQLEGVHEALGLVVRELEVVLKEMQGHGEVSSNCPIVAGAPDAPVEATQALTATRQEALSKEAACLAAEALRLRACRAETALLLLRGEAANVARPGEVQP